MDKKERFKELIRGHKWRPSASTTSAIITIFVFFSGIPSVPDWIKRICPNASKISDASSDFYTVKMMLPARMSGAEIFVDSQPAILAEQKTTVVTVRVQKKSTGHQFTVRKGDAVCEKRQFVNKSTIIIYPCQ
ncbi:hypothetical protein [Candidatus Electronema sp. JC]|uniref:hypothetical protein n=1 Tax=Candidatus Electronema sp. JC TaxID=3401570 RepID=UPI003B4333EC